MDLDSHGLAGPHIAIKIHAVRELDADTQAAVRHLADELESRFAAPPLNDQARSQLDAHNDTLWHVVVGTADALGGYAQLILDSTVAEAEIAAGPEQLSAVLDEVEHQAGQRGVQIWAHGKRSPLGPALAARDYREQRVLWQLRRALTDVQAVAPPPGVTIRPFVPRLDEQAWLAVNAAAFAGHGEQGGWTLRDLRAREAEPWFDPAGFLLAEREGQLLGFHWTKIHADGLGEVYVLGVAPAAQGLRLGSALLAAGLAHLAARGCPTVLLYVDDDNSGAVRLYESSGFTKYDVDVRFRRDAPAPQPPRS